MFNTWLRKRRGLTGQVFLKPEVVPFSRISIIEIGSEKTAMRLIRSLRKYL
jgi:hypothetical protein